MAKKIKKESPFGVKWTKGPYKGPPMVDFSLGVPKKPMFPPKVGVGVRPPRRKPIRKVTGTGKGPITAKLPSFTNLPTARKISGTGTKPIGIHVSESRLGGEPTETPQIRTRRKKWKPSSERPEGIAIRTEMTLPPGVEAFIDIAGDGDSIYRMMHATAHNPDHTHDAERDYWVCNHSRNASSWFACIGLVVLKEGRLGLYAQTWKGTELAWVWPNDDDCIYFYELMKVAPSKGKFCKGKYGPSFLWNQPYVLLSGS
jgi:hypothetical protein